MKICFVWVNLLEEILQIKYLSLCVPIHKDDDSGQKYQKSDQPILRY